MKSKFENLKFFVIKIVLYIILLLNTSYRTKKKDVFLFK